MLHVGLIMDGNRRYAAMKQISLYDAYHLGAQVFKNFLQWAKNTNQIKYVTAYVFSSDNWKRSKHEIEEIFKVFVEIFKKYEEEEIKITFLGRRDRMPDKIRNIISSLEERTKDYSQYYVQIAMDYNTEWHIHEMNNNIINIFPEMDLLIRSAGEKRLSDFALLARYAELFFIDPLWPECNDSIFNNILNEFYLRERRYGK